MARKKKIGKFDFTSMPHLRDPKQSIELSNVEMADLIEGKIKLAVTAGTYVSTYTTTYAKQLRDIKTTNDSEWVVNWGKRQLWNEDGMSQFKDDYNKKFHAWYATNEGAQEVYKACTKEKYWWYNIDGTSCTQEDAKAQGRFDAPVSYVDFINIIESYEGKQYIETNREQVFEVGDLVVLRTPYVGSYDYDPQYRNSSITRTDKRYGTVMEEGTGDIALRWASKGSRAISVLWFGKSEVVTVPEKVIKFESRKGRG